MVVGYNSEVKIMTIEKTKNLRLSSAVFWIRIRIRTDPHKEMPPGSGSGSAWTDADPDPDPGGKKA